MTNDSQTLLDQDQQAILTAGASMWTTAAFPDAGIPSVKMADGPMGVASGRVDERDVSLLTPCGTALGASWDVDLIERIGALVGGEAVRLGIDLVLAPNVNLARSPLAGRAFEYYSEDPLLAGLAGAAWITGLQSTGTGAIAKHLVCNDSETERDTMNAVVDERTLREVYLLPFEFAAAAGTGGMLTAYNRLNGSWCAEQGHVTTIVKQEWHFDGVLMSDWFGTHSTEGSLNGGLDLEMPGPARFLGRHSAQAVAAGDVETARLADAAERVARTARRFKGDKRIALAGADELLTEAAAAGFVMLKNDGDLLPLVPGRDKTIAVIGPNATAPCFQGGTFAKIAVKPNAVRPLEAIRARFGAQSTILFEPGVDPQPRLPDMPTVPRRDIGDGCTNGMTVDYFDNDGFTGSPVDSETRATNSLVWFVGVHDRGVFDRPAGIRASGRFAASTNGEHLFYLGGTGPVRLCVDGREVLRSNESVAAGDVMGKLKRGDADCVPVTLEASHDVLVEIEFTYQPARVQGLWYGIRPPGTPEEMLTRAIAAARAADVVVLVVGETSDNSVESKDRPDTLLPAEQRRLIDAVTEANPRTVIVANVGHAFDTGWDANAAALISAWYPGQEFGLALAQVLAGDREPGGRMPVTIAENENHYPALDLRPDAAGNLHYKEGTRLGYRGFAAQGITPRHAFGAGFGYARFQIGDVSAKRSADGGAVVEATVTNLSARAGAEVVQVYRTEPELTLLGFAKVTVAAGESQRVTLQIAPRRLQIWHDGWETIGQATLLIGRSSTETPFRIPL